MMIDQPTFHTDRLTLRPFCEDDLDDIFAYASNPNISKYLLWESHKDPRDSRLFLDLVQQNTCHQLGRLFFVFAIETDIPLPGAPSSGEKKVVGSIDFKNAHNYGIINPAVGQFDYAIAEAYWGNGIVAEAANALKGWAFKRLEIERLQAYCQPENKASERVMQKVGMTCEGRSRKCFLIKNQIVDLVHYAIIRDDFEKGQADDKKNLLT